MPGKIQILPEEVSQSIAAGEVIERPASVVKELMENAIDAMSSEIVVELKAGGLHLIRVYDNGEGIDRDDVPLAFQRYATSKMRRVEDLYAIQTLGFRGEALPSIASVSEMTVKTRVPDSITGIKVTCEGGEIKNVSEAGCPPGTEILVKNLFYNVPVKRKFLKSIQTELRQSLNHFLRLSLAYPSISFRFIHDDRIIYELLRTEAPLVRIEAVLGKEVYDHLQAVELEGEDIRFSGYVSLPTFSKGNADGIYLYVNRRFVKDRMIYKAILEAYRHVIPAGKFPIAILFITVPPSAVDVNVHPTKTEVKFKDQERIFRAVNGTLRAVLNGLPSEEVMPEGERKGKDLVYPAYSRATPLPLQDGRPKVVTGISEASRPEWGREPNVSFRILGQVQGTYILCEGKEGLIFIDQHAAHERLLFEKFKDGYEARSIPLTRFLIPIPIELSAEESLILESNLEEFHSMGFEIDPIGERVHAIRSIPSSVDQKDPKEMVREILDELSFLKREGKGGEIIHAILVTLACHSAIRGNSILRREEMEELVGNLSPFNLSSTCPHGRPIFFFYHQDELNRQFKRKSQHPRQSQ